MSSSEPTAPFDPAQYCAQIMDAVRAKLIRPSGVASNYQAERKQAWNAVATLHAREAVRAIGTAATTLLGGVPERAHVRPVIVEKWTEHFGRCIGQFSLMTERANAKGVVARTLDTLDPEHRGAVYQYLADQYVGILARLGAQPSMLERLTVPMITVETVDALFAHPAYRALGSAEIVHAVMHFPGAPAKHLDGMRDAIARLQVDPRYSDMDPSVWKHAASKWPSNPEAALDHMRETFVDLQRCDVYRDLSARNLWFAAMNYPRTHRAFLDRVVAQMAELRGQDAFEDLPNWIVEHACVRYSKNPQRQLERICAVRAELVAEGYDYLGATALHAAAVHHSRDPRRYLAAVQKRLEALHESEYVALLPEGELCRIAASYSEPVAFLREAHSVAAQLEPAMPTTSLAQRLRYCAYYPERMRALGAGAAVTAEDAKRVFDRRDRSGSRAAELAAATDLSASR